jgi:hypothetical protein
MFQVFVMRQVFNLFAAVIFATSVFLVIIPSHSNAGEKQFFSGIAGDWHGPGEIVAGKYKGTKFTCNLKGETSRKNLGMNINGYCRVGVFSQPMSAIIRKSGKHYRGRFLDGQKGEGMDVTSGRFSTSRFVVGLKRKKLDATMVARLDGNRKLSVTISVLVQGQLVPVIGMALGKAARTSQLNP